MALDTEVVCNIIRHVEIEDLGYLGEALAGNGVSCRYIDAVALPGTDPEIGDALVVLGGPMAAYETDRHAYLVHELNLIERYLRDGHPVLGICLGAQLLAVAAGAQAYPGERGKEIGWGEVELSDAGISDALWAGFPRRFSTFHWHGDTFDTPNGAHVLARTSDYVQAFRLGARAYGVQFHPEVVPAELASWIEAYHLELERERLRSEDILKVPNAQDHRRLALRFGENVARWLKASVDPEAA
jgi:GMP synthase (glutamine-hydrolysing)